MSQIYTTQVCHRNFKGSWALTVKTTQLEYLFTVYPILRFFFFWSDLLGQLQSLSQRLIPLIKHDWQHHLPVTFVYLIFKWASPLFNSFSSYVHESMEMARYTNAEVFDQAVSSIDPFPSYSYSLRHHMHHMHHMSTIVLNIQMSHGNQVLFLIYCIPKELWDSPAWNVCFYPEFKRQCMCNFIDSQV